MGGAAGAGRLLSGEKVRVLRVIARLNVGGPAIHATLLSERLDPSRFHSLLVSGAESATEGNYLALHGRRIEGLHVVPELGREIHPARDAIRFFKLMRRYRKPLAPDMIVRKWRLFQKSKNKIKKL